MYFSTIPGRRYFRSVKVAAMLDDTVDSCTADKTRVQWRVLLLEVWNLGFYLLLISL